MKYEEHEKPGNGNCTGCGALTYIQELYAENKALNHKIGNILKPCPFCGKEVTIEQKGEYGYDLHFYVSCCGIMRSAPENEDALIKKWNNRIGG